MATYQKHRYSEHAQNILSQLNKQRRSGHDLCDISIHVQNCIFWAHKCVLCGSSGYFASVLSNTTTSNKVELPGLTPQGVAVVLDFIYTSELNLSIENALETNNAANFLQVMDILDDCSAFLAAALRPPPEARNVHSTSSDVGNRQDSSVSSPVGSISPSSGSQEDSRSKFGYPVLSTILQENAARGEKSSTVYLDDTLDCDHQQSTCSESRPSSGQSDAASANNTPEILMNYSPEPNRPTDIHDTLEWSPGNREMTFDLVRPSERDRLEASGKQSATVVKLENEDNEVTSCSQENETAGPLTLLPGTRNSEQGDQQSSLRTKRFKASNLSLAFCEECRVPFLSQSALQQHRLSVHKSTQPFKCHMCPAAFRRSYELDRHLVSHSQNFAIQGTSSVIAGTSFTSELVDADKPFRCEICQVAFKTKGNLSQHILFRHTEERPFKCELCQAGFKRNFELNRHMNTHTRRKDTDTSPHS